MPQNIPQNRAIWDETEPEAVFNLNQAKSMVPNELALAHTPVATDPTMAGTGGVVPGPDAFEKPKSIKEYLELARQAGQTPTFTDDPTRQMAGMQGGEYQHGAFQVDDRTPRLQRDGLAGAPAQPAGGGVNMNNPLADPLVVAKEGIANSLDEIWESVAPGKPKAYATQGELQVFQKRVKERHEALIKAADDRFDRWEKLTKKFSQESVAEAMRTGDVGKLERIKKAASEPDKAKIWDDMVKEARDDAEDQGEALDPAALMERAAEYYREYMKGLDEAIGVAKEKQAMALPTGSVGGRQVMAGGAVAPAGAAIPGPDAAQPSPAEMLEYARSLKRANPKISDAEIAQGLRERFPGLS